VNRICDTSGVAPAPKTENDIRRMETMERGNLKRAERALTVGIVHGSGVCVRQGLAKRERSHERRVLFVSARFHEHEWRIVNRRAVTPSSDTIENALLH
jgi:hypothetical protein